MPESKAKNTKSSAAKKTTTKKSTTGAKKQTRAKKASEETKAKSQTTQESKKKQEEYKGEDWGDKLSDIAQKAYDAVKDGVQKLSDFASESSHVAKIKFEILNLSSDRKSLLKDVGQKFWNLHKAKSLQNLEDKFKSEFKKLADLEKKIAAKEKEVETVSERENE